jgi:steroid delta-isomerase-like uncharacterized protein
MFEENKQLCRRLFEGAWNRGDLRAVDETVSSNCRFHDPAFPALQNGAENYRRHIQMCREAFPDLTCSVDHVIAERNEVVIHWTVRGTHRGNFLGAAATNRAATVSGTSIHQIEGDKITELWSDWNLQSLQDQLGLGMTESEANKALARRLVEEVWNQKRPERFRDYMADGYTRISPNGTMRGEQGMRQDYDMYTGAFPDAHIQIDDMICEGDRVAMRFTVTGTQTGKLGEIAASGKRVTLECVGTVRIANGRVIEEHMAWDSLSLLRQIGAAPEMAARSASSGSRTA